MPLPDCEVAADERGTVYFSSVPQIFRKCLSVPGAILGRALGFCTTFLINTWLFQLLGARQEHGRGPGQLLPLSGEAAKGRGQGCRLRTHTALVRVCGLGQVA